MTSVAQAHDPKWETHPEACSLVSTALEGLCRESQFLDHLSQRMLNETGTRLADWIDRVSTPASPAELMAAGFVKDTTQPYPLYRHPQAQLPALVLDYGKQLVAIKVESVPQFLLANGLDSRCQVFGNPGSALRKACVDCHPNLECWIIERHGYQGWQVEDASVEIQGCVAHHRERLLLRRRRFDTIEEGFAHARQLIEASMLEIGRERTCDLFFEAERAYWQSRNDAGAMQRLRQDRLGLGWANHDHHTYRSSRQAFTHLMSILELMGFQCRERFYAGRQAGWGAQVLEQPNCGIVIFADVDLAPDEVLQDFAHEPLPPRATLGTVGLWCALHGEAFLAAGMHHLECQFDFEQARSQLAQQGVGTMKPFTDLPYLRQAFTEGQRWPVAEEALSRALVQGWITPEQAEGFRRQGAIGSHLELLQRWDGYKGFNQTGISDIISATDPRKQL
ncbi:MAG: hypothetical protein IT423_05795 [Pirellulaceae bacterium]|nr:hypothetical protein [Pirellulaceae bacterium]